MNRKLCQLHGRLEDTSLSEAILAGIREELHMIGDELRSHLVSLETMSTTALYRHRENTCSGEKQGMLKAGIKQAYHALDHVDVSHKRLLRKVNDRLCPTNNGGCAITDKMPKAWTPDDIHQTWEFPATMAETHGYALRFDKLDDDYYILFKRHVGGVLEQHIQRVSPRKDTWSTVISCEYMVDFFIDPERELFVIAEADRESMFQRDFKSMYQSSKGAISLWDFKGNCISRSSDIEMIPSCICPTSHGIAIYDQLSEAIVELTHDFKPIESTPVGRIDAHVLRQAESGEYFILTLNSLTSPIWLGDLVFGEVLRVGPDGIDSLTSTGLAGRGDDYLIGLEVVDDTVLFSSSKYLARYSLQGEQLAWARIEETGLMPEGLHQLRMLQGTLYGLAPNNLSIGGIFTVGL